MANDCLVTKLKSNVDNPNLNVLGEFNIIVNETSTERFLNVEAGKKTVRQGNLYFSSTAGGASIGTESDRNLIYVSAGSGKIGIKKYGIFSFNAEKDSFVTDIADFKYSSALKSIEGTFSGILNYYFPNVFNKIRLKGTHSTCQIDLEFLKNCALETITGSVFHGDATLILGKESLKVVEIENCPIEGTVTQFSENITTLNLAGTDVAGNISAMAQAYKAGYYAVGNNMSGTVESFVEALYGTKESNFTLYIPNSNKNLITLNGNVVKILAYSIKPENGSLNLYQSGTLVASYNGTTWTYA